MAIDVCKRAFSVGMRPTREPGSPAGYARALSAQDGFTLVETIVTMVAALVVLGATVTLLNSGQGIQARDSEWALTMQLDRAGLARIVRDIRQATKVNEAGAGSIKFAATIGGQKLEVKYECATAQPGTSFTQCVRFSAEEGKALPASGTTVAKDILNGSSVFTYTPNAVSPRAAIVKLEVPAKGTLKQASSSGYKHSVVLEDAAFMRNVYLEG
jgi:prepilin-type N-terminal cleavage/methylation domain-containing protein